MVRKKSFLVSTIVYGVGDVLTKSARLLLIPFYVGYLTGSELGIIAICQAVTTGFWAFLCLGTAQYIQRFMKDTPEVAGGGDAISPETLVSTVWWFRLVVGSSFTAIALLVAWKASPWLLPNIAFPLLALAILSGNFRASLSVSESGFIGQGRAVSYRLLTFLVFLSSMLLTILLVAVFEMGVWGAVVGEFASLSTWAVLMGIRHTWVARPSFSEIPWRLFARFAGPIIPHVVFIWGLMSSDRLVLSRFVTEEALGIYDISYLLGSGVMIFGTAMLLAWLPSFYEMTDRSKAADFFEKKVLMQITFCLAVTLSTNFVAYEIASVMASKYADEATPLVQLILPATFLLIVNSAFVKALVFEKKTTTISVLSGCALAINVGLNFLLDPWLGIYGAAWATIIAFAVMTLSCVILACRHLKVDWHIDYRALARILAVSVVALVVGYNCPHEFSFSLIAMKAVMIVACWALFYVELGTKGSRWFQPTLRLSPLQVKSC